MDVKRTPRLSSSQSDAAQTVPTDAVCGQNPGDTDGIHRPTTTQAGADGDRRISRFQIRRTVGEGTYGVVYLAYDPTLDRAIALKIPRCSASWSDKQQQLFLQEARMAARLVHRNVVTVFDASVCPDAGVFIAMEFVEGEPLSQRLARGTPSIEDTVRICGQVAEAVHEAHALRIIHRDLKPSNILIGKDGNAKVCDFGLALNDDVQQASQGDVSGTLAYMSPEQALGNAHLLDGRSDIWSLGVILYECLTGDRPFRGQTNDELREQILTRDPRPIHQINSAVPESLVQLCERCLQRNPSRRPRTALEFRHSLVAPPSRPKRIKIAASVGVVAALLAFAGIVIGHFSAQTRHELEEVRTGDLLGVAPRPIVFDNGDITSTYSYMEATGPYIPRVPMVICWQFPGVVNDRIHRARGRAVR